MVVPIFEVERCCMIDPGVRMPQVRMLLAARCSEAVKMIRALILRKPEVPDIMPR
jgi:hypothetical protein